MLAVMPGRTSMLRLFTGVKHLDIHNVFVPNQEIVEIQMFNSVIFNNLVFLSIPSRNMYQLDFQINTKTKFIMPNLRCLEITSNCECACAGEYTLSSIDSELVPSLKIVRTDEHWITNINDFQTLEVLEISFAEIDITALNNLNNLNIEKLSLTGCDIQQRYLNNKFIIPSLES